jgi:hypothetical protein
MMINFPYLVSLPERILRATAAGGGGFLYEASLMVLPGWLRGTRIYTAIVAGLLRITIELVGGAYGILPPNDVTAQFVDIRRHSRSHWRHTHLSAIIGIRVEE